MKIIIYIIILLSKILENALATVRLIVVSNGKKTLGAILNFVISIIWIFSAGIVIVDIKSDLFKAFFFCLGGGIGSYIGSLIENKLALGNNLILCIIDKCNSNIIDKLRSKGYGITTLEGYGKDSKKYIMIVFTPRKKRMNLVKDINNLLPNATIISENANNICGDYTNL